MDPRLTGLDLKTSLSAILDLVLPRACVVCGQQLIPQEQHICLECLADLPETHFADMSRNPMSDRFNSGIATDTFEPYAYAAALFHYSSDAGYRKISQALKYRRNFGAGKYFARMLGTRLKSSPLYADVDLVVPVPLHWSRELSRGYNQAAVIARVVSRELSCPCSERLLRRNRRTRTQTRVKVEAKAGNVAGAFSLNLRSERLPKVKHLLLIDDVFTTGATLSACYKSLRAAYGPSVRISVATLAVVGCR